MASPGKLTEAAAAGAAARIGTARERRPSSIRTAAVPKSRKRPSTRNERVPRPSGSQTQPGGSTGDSSAGFAGESGRFRTLRSVITRTPRRGAAGGPGDSLHANGIRHDKS